MSSTTPEKRIVRVGMKEGLLGGGGALKDATNTRDLHRLKAWGALYLGPPLALGCIRPDNAGTGTSTEPMR